MKFTLKFGKDEFSIETMNRDITIGEFADLVYAKTNVPPARQTYMIPGIRIAKGQNVRTPTMKLSSLSSEPFVEGTELHGMVIGTPEGGEFRRETATTAPEARPHGGGDDEEKGTLVANVPVGYSNLGNTCYLGAILAMLERAESFKSAVTGSSPPGGPPSASRIFGAWRNAWQAKRPNERQSPLTLFAAVAAEYPDFAERNATGGLKMQDSEEMLSRLFNALPDNHPAKALFEIGFTESTCLESAVLEGIDDATLKEKVQPMLEPQATNEIIRQHILKCYLGSAQKAVNHLMPGLELGMEDRVEKHTEVLDRMCFHRKIRKIVSLPKYLLVHMVRFEWKKANAAAGTKACRAKILRRVEYGLELDLYALCSDELKAKLQAYRHKRRENTDARTAELAAKDSTVRPDVLQASREARDQLPHPDGTFVLESVVTHIGRTADEGHYINWVYDESAKSWIKQDDDKSSVVAAANIDLQGGLADGPCPYLLLYRRVGCEDVE